MLAIPEEPENVEADTTAAATATADARYGNGVYDDVECTVDFENVYLRNLVSGGGWFASRADLYRRLAADFAAWVAAGAPAGAVSCNPGDFTSWAAGGTPAGLAAPGGKPMAAIFEIDDLLLASFHRGGYVAPPNHSDDHSDHGVDFHAADWFDAPEGDGLAWPRDAVFAPAVPGIHGLLDTIRGSGVAIVILTRRPEARRAETLANLKLVGLWAHAEACGPPSSNLLVMWPGPDSPWTSVAQWKETRRQALRQNFRVVLNVGTRSSDFGYYAESVIHAFTPFYDAE